jgi:NADH-quinone oxidoreductase subunit K
MIPLAHSLLIGAMLFALGLSIVLVRRELLFILMGLEFMFNAAALTVVAAGQQWGSADGQVLAIFIIAATASELVIALILVYLGYRQNRIVRVEELATLRDEGAP